MSSVTFSTSVGGDGSTVTDDDNATTGLGNGGALIRLVPMMQQVVNVAAHVVSISGGAGDDAAAAAASAAAASSSASAAAASYDSFDDRYLGSKTSDPSVDNDGNALITGAIYWNSSSSVMKVWTGSAWVNPNPAAGYLALSGGTMTGAITFAAGQTFTGSLPLSGGTMTGNITFNSTQFGTNVSTFLSTPSSANLAAALTDETGTGSAVFATSPTLVTPVLGTPTSGDLSNCTNAVGYELKSATTTVSISSATAPSAGQILTAVDSTTAIWQTPSNGATWVYLSTVTASGATTADIETTFDSTYNAYVLVASNVSTSGGGGSTQILCRQKIGGVYKTSSYAYGVAGHSSGGTSPAGGSSATYIAVTPISSIDITCADFVMYIYSPSSSTITNALHWQGTAIGSATYGFAGGGTNSTGVLTGVRFYSTSTGTISGTFRLYGIKNS